MNERDVVVISGGTGYLCQQSCFRRMHERCSVHVNKVLIIQLNCLALKDQSADVR